LFTGDNVCRRIDSPKIALSFVKLRFFREAMRAAANIITREQCGAQFLETASGSVMEGAIPYIYWHKDDLKALRQARRLLNRWQAKGWLSWSAWKTKPPRCTRPQQGRPRKKKAPL
jgi:hypothetical protein